MGGVRFFTIELTEPQHIYIYTAVQGQEDQRCCRNFRFKLQQHERQSVLPRASLAENDKILVFHVETIKSLAKVNAEYNQTYLLAREIWESSKQVSFCRGVCNIYLKIASETFLAQKNKLEMIQKLLICS